MAEDVTATYAASDRRGHVTLGWTIAKFTEATSLPCFIAIMSGTNKPGPHDQGLTPPTLRFHGSTSGSLPSTNIRSVQRVDHSQVG